MTPYYQDMPLRQVYGIGEVRADTLINHGIKTTYELAQATPAEVAEILDVTEATAEELTTGAKTTVGVFE